MSAKLEVSAICLVTLMVLVIIQITNATTYIVGDGDGWTLGVESWPKGKSFKAGDVLVFKYSTDRHNVVIVNKANYEKCEASGKTLNSGNDKITLDKGTSYFICGKPKHCDGGQKIAVIAN